MIEGLPALEQVRQPFEELEVAPELSISNGKRILDRARWALLLVTDKERRLLGIVTDYDICMGVLRGVTLDRPLREVMNRHPLVLRRRPPDSELLAMMDAHVPPIGFIPILSEEGKVVEVAARGECSHEGEAEVVALVMAGGAGKRLKEKTLHTPKPMLPVGGRPILESIVENLKRAGILDVFIATHYMSDVITKHFEDGSRLGARIRYLHEESPLGTAGSISRLRDLGKPLLVINGDILTEVDFRRMIAFHGSHQADLTVGVLSYELDIPYGILQTDHERVVSLEEKPRIRHFINAGIYLLSPHILGLIPAGRRYDMTELIQRLLDERRTVISFPIMEYWLDIGSPSAYQKAMEDFQ